MRLGSILSALALLTAAMMMAPAGIALAQQTVTFGRSTKVEPLAQFKPGVTTMAEVRAALGEPSGDGVARHNPREAQRIIWFYEYGQVRASLGSSEGETSLQIVLVFFKGDRYDGHLWFADKKLVSVRPFSGQP